MKSERALKLVIFDRDGTLNEARADYVKSPEEWVPIPGALEAVARLNHAGWHAVVACNQAGLGRGLFDVSALNGMHLKLNETLSRLGGRVDAIFICPHTLEDRCHCRKPLPGLYEQIGLRYDCSLQGVPAVGDTLVDLKAAASAGCEPHLVLSGKAAALTDQQIRQILHQVPGAMVHPDLSSFAHFLIERDSQRQDQRTETPGPSSSGRRRGSMTFLETR
jgi:D-glycero-D-manno-heptose 1,7-bisphosphate phosphatase